MSGLPESWASVPLLDVSKLVRGVTYTKGDARSEAFTGSIPVLRANNIQDRGFNLNDLVHVPESLVSEQQHVGIGDVVVATSSGSISVVGKAAQALEDMNVGFGAFCGLLRPDKRLHAPYFGFFFSSDDYRKGVSSMARGVNINNLKREDFESLELPLAPLPEQKRIADKLKAILSMKKNKFSFLELREAVEGEYDALTEAVFGLLAEKKPILKQVFDTKAKKMQFRRSKG